MQRGVAEEGLTRGSTRKEKIDDSKQKLILKSLKSRFFCASFSLLAVLVLLECTTMSHFCNYITYVSDVPAAEADI